MERLSVGAEPGGETLPAGRGALRVYRGSSMLPAALFEPGESASAIVEGDARQVLRNMPSGAFRTCVTSPPYWSLRDYGIEGQIGLEPTVQRYVEALADAFSEVRRVLADDGTLWLNIGDSYTSGGRTWRAPDRKNPFRAMDVRPPTPVGLKPKDLIGVPWRLALALQAAGWYLRADIIWSKPNCQPESVKDRPTRSHEYLFLLSKSERYYYDDRAVRGPRDRRLRTVWEISTRARGEVQVATFPPELVAPCVASGSEPGDLVLDPFAGSGTTGWVAMRTGRRFVGVELNPAYVEAAARRLNRVAGRMSGGVSHGDLGPGQRGDRPCAPVVPANGDVRRPVGEPCPPRPPCRNRTDVPCTAAQTGLRCRGAACSRTDLGSRFRD